MLIAPSSKRSNVLTEFVSHGVDISTAVVTGAAQGIGLAIAQTLSRHGATVVIADIDEAAAAQAAQTTIAALVVALE
jgi:NADP-dependent 3-hydroxy acid dehydrogenase YdfG